MNREVEILYILKLLRDCGKPGWDSYDGLAIDEDVTWNAIKLINKLPDDIKLTINEICPCSHGTIDFTWEFVEDMIVGFEVEKTGRVNYEIYWSKTDIQKLGNFHVEDNFPRELLEGIKEYLKLANESAQRRRDEDNYDCSDGVTGCGDL